MKRFWVSWLHRFSTMGAFELNSPWWISGVEGGFETICAAVVAKNEKDVYIKIGNVYDIPPESIVFRGVAQRSDDWLPFCDRFPRADWMKWSE